MKKKKICIVTIFDDTNIGNRLQNYALQNYVSNFFTVQSNSGKSCLFKVLSIFKTYVFAYCKNDLSKRRMIKFYSFDKYLKKVHYSCYKPAKLNKKFDFFIAGSDQIRNFTFFDNNTKLIDYYTLQFADQSKRYAVSASLGINKFTSEDDKIYYEKLKNFKNISVREEHAKHYLDNLMIGNVICTFDPTILLNKNDWLKVAKKPKYTLPDCFVLSYFLPKPGGDIYSGILNFCNKHNMKLIEVTDNSNLIGPSEFLYLINKAEYFFTNSFHGLVFSMIFEKKVKYFERIENDSTQSMNSRIENLVNKFSVDKNIFANDEEILSGNYELKLINYDKDKFEFEKSKLINYLKKILEE